MAVMLPLARQKMRNIGTLGVLMRLVLSLDVYRTTSLVLSIVTHRQDS